MNTKEKFLIYTAENQDNNEPSSAYPPALVWYLPPHTPYPLPQADSGHPLPLKHPNIKVAPAEQEYVHQDSSTTTIVNKNDWMSGIRKAVPQLPLPLAITLLMVNAYLIAIWIYDRK